MNQGKPFFSVVTPTYDRAHFLPQMVASVQAQTFGHFEHIIVDDGSTDGTEELVRSFTEQDPRIRYIKQENKGRSEARNTGIRACKGTYVCFLDSDDLWLNNHLELLNKAIGKLDVPSFLHTGLVWFYQDGSPEKTVRYTPMEQFHSPVEYVIANQFAPDCVCIHRDILQKYLFDPELYINEDVELWARIAAAFPVVAVAASTAKLRVHDANTDKVFNDNVTPRMQSFSKLLDNPDVRSGLSKAFVNNRKRGLHELLIRQHHRMDHRGPLVWECLRFLLLYPAAPRNASKVVMILYALPGGRLLKSLIAKWKHGKR